MARSSGRPKTVTPDGETITRLRTARFPSQLALAVESGVSLHKISDMEQGKPTSLAILNRLAKCFGLEDGQSLTKIQSPSSNGELVLTPNESVPIVSGTIDFSGLIADRSRLGSAFDMQGEILKVITKHGISLDSLKTAFQIHVRHPEANIDPVVTVLCRGTDANGTLFWAYLGVKCSRAKAFKEARDRGNFNLLEYGQLLESGEGEEPPDRVKERMVRRYGVNHFFEQELLETIERIKREHPELDQPGLNDDSVRLETPESPSI